MGTCHVTLASFLDGEVVVNVCSPCIEESGETESESMGNDNSTSGTAKTQSGKRNEEKKKGKGGMLFIYLFSLASFNSTSTNLRQTFKI